MIGRYGGWDRWPMAPCVRNDMENSETLPSSGHLETLNIHFGSRTSIEVVAEKRKS